VHNPGAASRSCIEADGVIVLAIARIVSNHKLNATNYATSAAEQSEPTAIRHRYVDSWSELTHRDRELPLRPLQLLVRERGRARTLGGLAAVVLLCGGMRIDLSSELLALPLELSDPRVSLRDACHRGLRCELCLGRGAEGVFNRRLRAADSGNKLLLLDGGREPSTYRVRAAEWAARRPRTHAALHEASTVEPVQRKKDRSNTGRQSRTVWRAGRSIVGSITSYGSRRT
jgi:hypothetical protein